MAKKVYERDFYGKKLSIEVGELAKQSDGAVLVRLNDTAVLVTAVAGSAPKDLDYFPLTVSYSEKLYAVGKIPGSFLRREGREGEHATLTGRLIDRPMRPLFPDGFRNEVQIINTVLSVDLDATPEMSSMLGASLAVSISDIPFDGPVAGVYELSCVLLSHGFVQLRVQLELLLNPCLFRFCRILLRFQQCVLLIMPYLFPPFNS